MGGYAVERMDRILLWLRVKWAWDLLNYGAMTALLWVILSFFVSGFFWMVSEIIKAPEGVEDSQGFRVVRASTAPKARPAHAGHRGLHWAARRA